jgi:outer membrane protein assembly factor BamE (lipoprotein component of BamABCDE complex)
MKFYGLLLAGVLLAACSARLNEKNLSQIKPGQTEEQVREILGAPTGKKTADILTVKGTVYYYQNAKGHAEITFVDGQVAAINHDLKP